MIMNYVRLQVTALNFILHIVRNTNLQLHIQKIMHISLIKLNSKFNKYLFKIYFRKILFTDNEYKILIKNFSLGKFTEIK